MSHQKDSSWAWILLPAFFALLGGVFAYFALRGEDIKFARMALYLGIVESLVFLPGIVIALLLFGTLGADPTFEAQPMQD